MVNNNKKNVNYHFLKVHKKTKLYTKRGIVRTRKRIEKRNELKIRVRKRKINNESMHHVRTKFQKNNIVKTKETTDYNLECSKAQIQFSSNRKSCKRPITKINIITKCTIIG